MKGDFTRFPFDSAKHYDAVLMQQGRVQTDADWNEQVMIAAHRNRTETLDIIGPTGAPQDLLAGGVPPFLVTWDSILSKLFVNFGRYYVQGLMVESEGKIDYETQPGAALPPLHDGVAEAGIYIFYLDVWRRHITSLEDPDIREVALAGADSGTRSELVWQVRAEWKAAVGVDINSIPAADFESPWQPANTKSSGKLDVQAETTPVENQLYRVEIHRAGTSGLAADCSFKWSRDNGTVVACVATYQDPPTPVGNNTLWRFTVDIDRNGRDSFSSFLPGQMVELSNEQFALLRKPGIFGTITAVVGDKLTLEVLQASANLLSTDPTGNPLKGAPPTVRRWDNTWNPDLNSSTLLDVDPQYMTLNDRIILERDITVLFSSGAADLYRTGDYWLIPARTVSATNLVDWDANVPQLAAGEQHYYAPLALVKVQENGTIANASDIRDMRRVFPTLRSLGGGGGGIVTGTGTTNVLTKWQSDGGSVLVNSNIADDGSTVTIGGALKAAGPATVQGPLNVDNGNAATSTLTVLGAASLKSTLKVGTATSAVAITQFTSSDIKSMSAQTLSSTVPTSQAVKNFVNWAVPPGTVMAFASETIPEGWRECNGASLDGGAGSPYQNLFTAIGKAFGGGNGSPTGFNLPDLRGRFVRGWNHSSGRDPDAGSRTNQTSGVTVGDRVGSIQDNDFKSHNHPFSLSTTTGGHSSTHTHSYSAAYNGVAWLDLKLTHGGGNTAIQSLNWQPPPTGGASNSHTHAVGHSGSTDPRGGSETRPKNVYLTYIIKL
jgi:microcystin-dependent protein